jgi:exopolysaccharide biosynthesis polyprenyl glycosylphosphotransferase
MKFKTSLYQRPEGRHLKLSTALLQTAALGSSQEATSAALAPLAPAPEVAATALVSVPEVAGAALASVSEAAGAALVSVPEVAGAALASVPDVAEPALPSVPEVAAPALAPAPEVDTPALESVRRLFDGRDARIFDSRTWSRVRLVADAAMLCVASSGALLIPGAGNARSDRWLAAAFPLVTLALFYGGRIPDERLRVSAVDAAARVLGVISLSAMLMVAAGSITGIDHPATFALRLWLLAAVAVSVARIGLLSCRRYALSHRAVAAPTLIVGAGVVGARLAMRLFADPGYGLRPVGFLDTDPMPTHDDARSPLVPVLGGPNDLAEAIASTGARHVILAFTTEPDHLMVQKVRDCQALGIEVSLVPRMYEAINERAALDYVGGLPLLSLRRTDPRGWKFGIKHAFDRVIAAGALAALVPLLITIALAVRLTSSGPVLFRQRRVGRDGREFDVLKFRTMLEADSSRRFVLPDGCAPGGVEGADRRTPIGRWLRGTSLDELPQLLNVLRGEMSLVGPRPERPEFVARFDEEIDHYSDRHRVKSGITGWAQVNGLRGQTSIADRVEWDNYYIENWSLRFDLRVMVLTIAEVFRLRDTALGDAVSEAITHNVAIEFGPAGTEPAAGE